MVLSALGFCLLDGRLPSYVLARLGILTYFAAAIVGVVAETIGLTGTRNYPVVVAYVVLAFTGQAVIGSALSASGLVPRWVGWATVLWNLSWLVGLVLAHPQNVYFPVLHLVMPALIGVTLLVEAASSARRPPPGAVDVQAPA